MIKKFDDYPDVIKIDDLMEILGIGRNCAYRLLKKGEIKTVKVGKRYIIPKESVKVFLSSAN